MRRAALRISTILFWIYFFASSTVLIVVAALLFAVTRPFDRQRRALHMLGCFWGYHYIWLMPFWKPEFEGLEKIRRDRTYLIISNHQSLLDIFLLYGIFRHFKWVAKRELFKIPLVGWNMLLNDYVALARGDRRSIVEMMRTCRTYLENGSSILIFPEGTRSPDGELHEFKPGAVSLATSTHLEIVPIVVDGTWNSMPESSYSLRRLRTRLRVRVLDPVPHDVAPRPHLSDFLHDRMRDELASLRAEAS